MCICEYIYQHICDKYPFCCCVVLKSWDWFQRKLFSLEWDRICQHICPYNSTIPDKRNAEGDERTVQFLETQDRGRQFPRFHIIERWSLARQAGRGVRQRGPSGSGRCFPAFGNRVFLGSRFQRFPNIFEFGGVVWLRGCVWEGEVGRGVGWRGESFPGSGVRYSQAKSDLENMKYMNILISIYILRIWN